MPIKTRLPDSVWLRSFRKKLGDWFDDNVKDLPWRRTKDPYSVWVSEIMLQQTQVATVCEYFTRFMKALPTVQKLADAKEEQVMRLWEGLGYYRRARQLHQAAKIVTQSHAGIFPSEFEQVRSLPGIGRYTAGAILSIAHDIPHPILEANTIRVYSRLLGYEGNTLSATGQKLLWSMAEALLPKTRSGRLNQALMELGREVCKSRKPLCPTCPVAKLCHAAKLGLQERIPRPKTKTKFEEVRETAVIVRRRNKTLLMKRADGGRWAGLWDFPRFPLVAEHPPTVRQEIIDGVRRLTGVTVVPGELVKTLHHGVTRFRITLECREAEFVSEKAGKLDPSVEEVQWVSRTELENFPLNSTGRKLARMVEKR